MRIVIYGVLAVAVAGNNNFRENYDRRRFLPLDDTLRFLSADDAIPSFSAT